MPRDRKACNKAVNEAWKKERALVLEGKGTRNWDEEQQLEIIELGKVYDEDGKAFEGQHMKGACAYPEHQDNPDNIQFLSVREHFKAHKENWQIQTNWYYDPETSMYIDFDEGDPVPCAIIDLSYPLAMERKSTTEPTPDKSQKMETSRNNPESAPSNGGKQTKKGGRLNRIRERIREEHRSLLSTRFYTENEAYYDDPVEKFEACMQYLDEHENDSAIKQMWEIVAFRLKPIADNPDVQNFVGQAVSYGIKRKVSQRLDRHIRQSGHGGDLIGQTIADINARQGESTQLPMGLVEMVEKQPQNHGSVSIDGLSECSKLYSMGYTVKKSHEERRDILDEFISTDGIEKAQKYLQFLINTRSAMKNGIYEKAVSKWQEDLDYISEQ